MPVTYNWNMTQILKQAFEKVSATLAESEQDEFGRHILAVLEDNARWDASFAKPSDKLRALADQALEHYRAGRTDILDPEKL